jgi:protein-tyrosine phosphatase
MIARPYWITPQLAIVPRPRGSDWLDDEMIALREAGIDVVVSMLEKDEASELGLEREALSAEQANVIFVHFPISDRSTPSAVSAFKEFLKNLEHLLAHGKRVGVHCRASIGRSSITVVSLLLRSGVPFEDAWRQVSTARGCSVPDTSEQQEWVNRHMRPTR